ncbi:substrate-binding periplasmic protein [Pseudoalteromonas sp. T1lg65]|uniref:substrate-binding periplasmic protein n=1 Tax=Pseudoalteromonas sp. T1lg65 TaxID=2077101 RepID=UPI003F78B038
MKTILALFFLLSLQALATQTPTQVFITTGQWPPYMDQTQQDQGCVAAVIRDAFALSDIEVRFIFMPWERAYQEGMKQDYIGSAYWYFSEQRSRDYIYTKQPLTEEVSRFYHLKDLPFNYTSHKDLKPYLLLLNKGLTYPEELIEAIEQLDLDVTYSPYTSKNIALILRRRADVTVLAENTAQSFMRALPKEEAEKITAQQTPAFIRKGYLLINKHGSDYAQVFDEGVSKLWGNAEYVEKHLARCASRL